MQTLKCTFPTAFLAVMTALGLNLDAAPVSITSRGAIAGNDYVDWSTLGLPFAAPSIAASSQLGFGVTLPDTPSLDDEFERVNEGTGAANWNGNFAAGDALILTGFAGDPQTITIEFSSPVFGAGAQIQPAFFVGAFNAFLTAYDDVGGTHSFSFAGESTVDVDNSAIFVGVLNTVAANITKLELSVEVLDDRNDPSSARGEFFAINRLELNRAVVPDSGEYLAQLFALTIVGMCGIRAARTRRSIA